MVRVSDGIWNHVEKTDEDWNCRFCEYAFAKGVAAQIVKCHLAGVGGPGTKFCSNVPEHVKMEALQEINGGEKKRGIIKSPAPSSSSNVATVEVSPRMEQETMRDGGVDKREIEMMRANFSVTVALVTRVLNRIVEDTMKKLKSASVWKSIKYRVQPLEGGWSGITEASEDLDKSNVAGLSAGISKLNDVDISMSCSNSTFHLGNYKLTLFRRLPHIPHIRRPKLSIFQYFPVRCSGFGSSLLHTSISQLPPLPPPPPPPISLLQGSKLEATSGRVRSSTPRVLHQVYENQDDIQNQNDKVGEDTKFETTT